MLLAEARIKFSMI